MKEFLISNIFGDASRAGKCKGVTSALGQGLGRMGACMAAGSLGCPTCVCALPCKSVVPHAGGRAWGQVSPWSCTTLLLSSACGSLVPSPGLSL